MGSLSQTIKILEGNGEDLHLYKKKHDELSIAEKKEQEALEKFTAHKDTKPHLFKKKGNYSAQLFTL